MALNVFEEALATVGIQVELADHGDAARQTTWATKLAKAYGGLDIDIDILQDGFSEDSGELSTQKVEEVTGLSKAFVDVMDFRLGSLP